MDQQQEVELDYMMVPLQELDPRPQLAPMEVTILQRIAVLDRPSRIKSLQKVLCYKDSGIGNQRIIEKSKFEISHFFNAFSAAYTQHGDILLVPDQIWIMISFFISKYINDNAEKLRHKLVKHEGVKTLQIREQANSKEQSLEMQKNWQSFFVQIIKAIQQQTRQGVVEAFICDFTTTNIVYKTVSTSLIMNSMKKFFKYKRTIGKACGINNVYIAGQRVDWTKMVSKLQNLQKFDVDGKVKQYIRHVKVILNQFVRTYDFDPDLEWWNSIMTTPEKRRSYLSEQLIVQGWILHFFGIYEKTPIKQFPQMNIEVPITLVNEYTEKTKELLLISDWVSVSKLDEKTYKPDVGLAIIEISESDQPESLLKKKKRTLKLD